MPHVFPMYCVKGTFPLAKGTQRNRRQGFEPRLDYASSAATPHRSSLKTGSQYINRSPSRHQGGSLCPASCSLSHSHTTHTHVHTHNTQRKRQTSKHVSSGARVCLHPTDNSESKRAFQGGWGGACSPAALHALELLP